MLVRLNKYLSEKGLASRREADTLIAEGQVLVNGAKATMGMKIESDSDKVEVLGRSFTADAPTTYMLYKPAGYVTSSAKTRLEPRIVLDLVPESPRVFPVGRLDKETEGLLLLTNDGVLAYRLTHPSFECEKEYEAHLEAPLTQERIRKLQDGMRLEYRKTKPTTVIPHPRDMQTANIILTEGKNRQVRKVFGKVGCEVLYLRRVRVKFLNMGQLKKGEWRKLTDEEVTRLKDV